MSDRPNFLVIVSDQHRFDCLGVNGHPLLQTPNLDRLAADGMNFTHAFTPSPVCVPARNSLLHGVWPMRHLAIANPDTEAPRGPVEGLATFPQTLRQAGYWLAHVGKWGVDRQRGPRDFGFHEYVPDGDYGPWRAARGLPPVPWANSWFGEVDPHVRPEESALGWGADQAIRMLETATRGPNPFFVRWDTTEPHLPSRPPEPFASMYPPDGVPPWPGFADDLAGKPFIQRQQRRTWKLDDWTWAQWAPVVARYLGVVSLLDAQLGRVLAALARLGLAEHTVVVYTTDHGDLCGSHGMIDKHYVMYDDVVRVPLIVRWPAQVRAGSQCAAFVTHALDLAATFCAAAGAAAPTSFQGQSLLPLLHGQPDNGRSDIFATYHGNQFGLYSQRMVRDREWKYVWNATAEDELYDLRADPGELRNRVLDPACRGELTRLRTRLVAWMEQTQDRLLNGWTRQQLLEGLK
jgi:arylsulfatase A-like enzyme